MLEGTLRVLCAGTSRGASAAQLPEYNPSVRGRARHDPAKIKSELAELQTLSKPSAEQLDYVERLLESPRDGVQLLAARTLAKWKRPRSKEPLRAWILHLASLPSQSSRLKPASECLAPFLAAQDAAWVLELYFSAAPRKHWISTYLVSTALLPLLRALPAHTVSKAASAYIDSSCSVAQREAAVHALFAAGDKNGLDSIGEDPSPRIRGLVHNLRARSPAA